MAPVVDQVLELACIADMQEVHSGRGIDRQATPSALYHLSELGLNGREFTAGIRLLSRFSDGCKFLVRCDTEVMVLQILVFEHMPFLDRPIILGIFVLQIFVVE